MYYVPRIREKKMSPRFSASQTDDHIMVMASFSIAP